MKTVLFFPGFKSTEEKCRPVLGCIEEKGYHAKFGMIDWNGTTFDDWIEQARMAYAYYDPKEVILAGHSLGAVTAFALAAESNPYALWLMSLSGRFAEDIPRFTQKTRDHLGARVVESLGQVSFGTLVATIGCTTLLILGDLEAKQYPELAFRVHETYEILSAKLGLDRVQLVEAIGAQHNPAGQAYLHAIARSI